MRLKSILFQFFLLFLLLYTLGCKTTNKEVVLTAGMKITQSVTIKRDTFLLNSVGPDSSVITISGHNIVIDFNGAVLKSTANPQRPDLFRGTGIRVENGSKIKIKNLIVQGFKVGLLAVAIDSFSLEDANLSYNYRQDLKSTQENEEDWKPYHHNEKDEWLRYGAAVYLKNCNQAEVKNLQVTGGQNGLLLVHCDQGLFYNNTLQFNSGIGIGLYRSSHNWIMHNQLDWNIRGYNHGIYNRRQGSAGILVYEQSNKNTFSYNSATHSGDGFLLWPGQSTMDSGEGGCNNNLVYGNDFSHAANNGVEITFSSNNIINNRLEDCDYGISGGYNYQSLILGNTLKNNNHGIAFENGQFNIIRHNHFDQNDIGIQLWERTSQPPSRGFANKRNIESKNYEISDNFFNDKIPLKISDSKEIKITQNTFQNFERLWEKAPKTTPVIFTKNKIYPAGKIDPILRRQLGPQIKSKKDALPNPPKLSMVSAEYAPPPLADGQKVQLPAHQLRGRQYMLMTEWGPYDFKSPTIWLRAINEGVYTFAIFGPQGNWKMTGGQGFSTTSRKRGSVPATITATRINEAEELSIHLEFIGEEVTTTLGEKIKRGKGIPFSWKSF